VMQIKEGRHRPPIRKNDRRPGSAGRSWTPVEGPRPRASSWRTARPAPRGGFRGSNRLGDGRRRRRAARQLSVFSGRGRVLQRPGQRDRATPNEAGRARRARQRRPVKLQLQVSREGACSGCRRRRSDPTPLCGIPQGGASGDLAAGREPSFASGASPTRTAKLQGDHPRGPARPAVAFLLLAGHSRSTRGDAAKAARDPRQRGRGAFPSDERFDAGARAPPRSSPTMPRARTPTAAPPALAKRGDSAEAWIVLGDVERRQGRRLPRAIALRTTQGDRGLPPTDARRLVRAGCRGEARRENVKRARAPTL